MRPEPAPDPSMDEILASIRKIIAEDPPGARQAPTFGTAAAQPTPAASPAGVRPQALSPQASSFAEPSRETFRGPAPASFPKGNAFDVGKLGSYNTPRPASSDQRMSVDQQMSELFGRSTSSASGAKEYDSSPAPTGEAPKPVVLPKATATEPEPFMPSSASTAKPGFTVTRDGYVPASARNDDRSARGFDDLNLTLGPSPFAARTSSEIVGDRKPERDIFDLGGLVPERSAPVTQPLAGVDKAANADATFTLPPTQSAPLSGQPFESSASAGFTSPVEQAQSRDLLYAEPAATTSIGEKNQESAAEKTASQSLAAVTSALQASVFLPDPIPVSASSEVAVDAGESYFETATEVDTEATDPPDAWPAAQEISETVAETVAQTVAETAPAETESKMDRAAVVQPGVELPSDARSQMVVAVASSPAAQAAPRSLEDVVSDLLTPLLKSWLEDNMPRIVEHALRREMNASANEEHKRP